MRGALYSSPVHESTAENMLFIATAAHTRTSGEPWTDCHVEPIASSRKPARPVTRRNTLSSSTGAAKGNWLEPGGSMFAAEARIGRVGSGA